MATNSLIEGELFHKITRDERQEECRRKWIKNRCVGTIVASTGFGTVKAGHIVPFCSGMGRIIIEQNR